MQRQPRDRVRAGQRMQLEGRAGDDAERAFGADEEMLQVEAGVVLAQAVQAVPDPAVGEHHFEAEHVLARIAVAQHAGAAGVGRDVAADLARAFGAEADRVEPCRVGGRRLLHGASTQPASTTIELLATSIERMRRMRARLITTGARLSARGTAPSHRLVLPPCGTTGTPAAAQARTTAATCSVVDGRTTQQARPRYRPRQS